MWITLRKKWEVRKMRGTTETWVCVRGWAFDDARVHGQAMAGPTPS